MAGRTVRVRGLPAELPPDRVADKLTIHFLRSRNGGGDIAEVRVLPGPPPCGLITFEAPEVAQRILKLKDHVLAIGGMRYPLEVTLHTEELSPDEIFIRACVTIDYGKLPTGKTLLRDLHKGYSNVQFNFDSKNTHCVVQGPFTELQAFSRDLLGSLNLGSKATGEILLPGSSGGAKTVGMHDHQQVPDSTEPAEETAKQPNWDQVRETTAKVPSPRGPVDGEAAEQAEDFSLVMDLDIYLYMQRFCTAQYQAVLRQHRVDVVDVSSDGITILYLQPSGGLSGDMEALREARLALQQLYQQLEVSLRKEKFSKRGLGMDSQALRALTRDLQKLYPQLLCHEDVKQIYLIGNLVDVSQAKQYLQDSITRRGAARTVDMLSSRQPSRPTASSTTEALLHLPKVSVDSSVTRLNSGRPELKGELKLAANFSALKADRSQADQGLLLNQDSPPVGQVQLSRKHSSDAPGLSDPTAVTQKNQPPVPTTGEVLGSAAEPQKNNSTERDHVEGGVRLPGHKVLSPLGGKEKGTSQHPGDSKSSGPIGHHSLAGSTFDVTRTSSALDSKPSASRPQLRRSNSFSLPRSEGSDKSRDSGSSRVSEEMSLDFLQWSYLRDACRVTIDELCRGGKVQISERRAGDCTVLTLQAEDRSRLFQAKWQVEALVQKCPDLVCQSLSYSELAVDGPDDSALSELCSLLRGKSLQVGLRKDKCKLYLAFPKEMLPGVTEAFHMFSSRGLCALKSSSVSPGPESTGQSSVIQPSRSQDTVLDAALSSSLESLQMGLQQLNISSQAVPTDMLRASRVPETEEKRPPSPWIFQQARGQEEANGRVDSGAGQGGSSLLNPAAGDKPSPAGLRESQEQLKTKLSLGEPDITRLKQVLPDRFQFARDKGKSRGGHHEAMGQLRSPTPAAEGAPHSLPTCLYRATAAELPPAGTQQAPAAEPRGQGRAQLPKGSEQEEPDLPSQQRRDSSLGQESGTIPPGQCDACQGSGVTCQGPCGHALCRTCFAADSVQPACCSFSSAARSPKIQGTFKISSLSQSLPGYYRDLTLQVSYSIPDGVQGVGDPRPGQSYKGGYFCAFLPDNKEGQKTALLLKKAFEHGLTFQIKSCNGEERVTWGLIPHKTSLSGGKARNGYPDAQYLREVRAVLKKMGIA
ncbi:interferon-induced 35 kDa protein [Pitangus sulphuratus]|nr:interferon-induced 35 kDa protein [Pitangus sulphuratus]